jgi:hypothetical protein
VAVCDVPTINQIVPLFRDSSNCRILSLAPSQRNRTSTDPNEGFEDVACDPVNGKLYVIQEKNPMLMWSVDFTSGVYSELINIQSLPSWTSLVTDVAGLTYDSFTQSLYVLSQESKVVVQSTLNGTILGSSLNVSMMNAPEGLSFEPVSGDLIVVGEPNEIARFSKRIVSKSPTKSPTKAPTDVPSQSPSVRPVKAPVKFPLAVPVPIPVTAPTPISVPIVQPTAPTPIAAPVPVTAPIAAPVVPPIPAPVKVPVVPPMPAPAPVPVKVPTAVSPIQVPTKLPSSAPNTLKPTVKPSDAPTRNCGVFGLRLFCPLTFCGLFGRLFRLCN